MFCLFATVALSFDEVLKAYSLSRIPIVLYNEEIGDLMYENSSEISDNTIEVNFTSRGKRIRSLYEKNSNRYQIIWAEIVNGNDWKYSIPNQTVIRITTKYIEMLFNSFETPKVERIITHRTCIVNERLRHRLTVVVSIGELFSLHYLEYKELPNGKDSFVTHHVLSKESKFI